jgi:hypothetical protein
MESKQSRAFRSIVIILLLSAVVLLGCAEEGLSREGLSVVEVGGRVAEYCVMHQMGICDYQNFCVAFGVLKYAGAVGDKHLVNCVIAGYGPYLKRAEELGREAVEKLYVNGVFKGHPAKPYYQANDGVGFLLYPLLELDAPEHDFGGAF